MHKPNKTPIHQDIYSFKVNLVFGVKIRTVLCCCHESALSTATVLAREQAVYGQVTQESSYPKLCGRKTVMSPEMLISVARNFIMLNNIQTSLLHIHRACFVSSKIKSDR